MKTKILVTGGAGFIGSNFIRYMLERYDSHSITNLDKLTYAGNPDNLRDIAGHPDYAFVQGDICDRATVSSAMENADAVVHFAAESHVDRSIGDPSVFVSTNVLGTHTLLEEARERNVSKFVHVSTDEVYGSLGSTGYFTEGSPLVPNSPYSASKAGSDLLARSYFRTYKLPVVITRCSNNYGPYQFPEKLIPLMIINAVKGEGLPVYGDGLHIRDWLHVTDHCRAIDLALRAGNPGEVYNIGGNNERPNLDIVHFILDSLNKPRSQIKHVTDRLGHDRRYAIDSSKARRDLGWKPSIELTAGLKETITWYTSHTGWWERLLVKNEVKR